VMERSLKQLWKFVLLNAYQVWTSRTYY
jgi:hypothetical protein